MVEQGRLEMAVGRAGKVRDGSWSSREGYRWQLVKQGRLEMTVGRAGKVN